MYKLIGTKWGDPQFGTPSGTINWQANLSGLDTPSSASVSDLVTSLAQAFDRWEDVASVQFANGGGGIAVGIGSFSTDSNPDNDDAAATASWSLGGGSIQPQNPIITFNSDLTWAPSGGGGFDFFAVALHEIGHILGLDHPSDFDVFPDEIMNLVVRTDDLGAGDIEGIQDIYGTETGDEAAPEGGRISAAPSDGGGGGGAIGLLVGLLALVFGMFTGGAGAAVAMAAARVAGNGDDEAADDDEGIAVHGSGCGCAACCGHSEVILPDGSVQVTHVTFVDLPAVDFDYDSFGAGDDPDEAETEEFLLV